MHRRVPGSLSLAALVVLLVGCNSQALPAGKVRGTVTLDGEPLRHGAVFSSSPAGRGAAGAIQSDGTFALQTDESIDGAVEGRHLLAVVAYKEDAVDIGPEDSRTLVIPERYTSPHTSGLSVDVVAGKEQNIVLNLESKE